MDLFNTDVAKNIFMTQAQGPIYTIEQDVKSDKEKKHGAINAL